MEEKYSTLIDDYLRDRLTPEQKQEFGLLLRDNEAFRKELLFRESTVKAFGRMRHKELKARLAKLATEPEGETTQTHPLSKNRKTQLLAAAVLTFCVVGLSFLLLLKPSTSDLYATYFSAYPNVVVPLERSAEKQSTRMEAYSLYEAEQYERAYTLLKTLESDPEAQFYAAIAAMKTGQIHDAIPLLLAYRQMPATKLGRQATWYLALAYLRTEDTQAAKALLASLAAEPGYLHEKASELLQKLK